ncbi:GNAT family N-acetyltransferase [Clostridium sp.]
MLKHRHFKYLKDYNSVYEMLAENYKPNNSSGNMLPAEFEYCFCHPHMDLKSMSRSGVWEYDNSIIACAHIEFKLGKAYFEIANGYNYLREEMLDFSEQYLYGIKEDGTTFLSVRVPQSQYEFKKYVENRGYTFTEESARYCLPLDKDFEVKLPEGFKIISLFDGVDHAKIQIAIQLGFGHKIEDITGDHLANSLICSTGPHFKPDMNYIVIAPNGNYVAYGGFWYDKRTDLAYLEPLCTHPDYRHKGLSKAILNKGMNECKKLGAKYCTDGSQDFYYNLGFKKYNSYSWWYKEF